MKQRAGAADGQGSPLGLRLVHAVFFLGVVTPAAVATSWTELSQLFAAFKGPYVCGDPPLPFPVLGALLGLLSAAVLLFFFVRARSAPLWVSIVGLVGAGCSIVGMQFATPRRSCVASNLDVLAAARQLHRVQVDALQRTARVSTDFSDWEKIFNGLGLPASPGIRTRTFRELPLKIARMSSADESDAQFEPGTVGVFISSDGVTFELHPIGVGKNQERWPLSDDKGQPLVLKGVFNPEVPGAGADLDNMAGQ